jgi:hypothetical protein
MDSHERLENSISKEMQNYLRISKTNKQNLDLKYSKPLL